ncbi:hypothetical protein LMG31886_07770 [Xanthomonas hydrangeae]|nr:hypothetical protein LMG31885_07730 [Xanthomonas hydrangeae]CAD7724857.1 hypothetical protein LMG31885_07730 [Xanthomonas hydrangeae]CAD7725444.1 hypothetical protein LMG31886_07770 [Xanthomonas hydrangeae]CAD7725448.1 hypothetical protein LMG31886_07770 [Xanthomonas hydrangeae]
MPAEATRPGRGKLSGVTDSTEQSQYMRKASEPGTARTKRRRDGVSALQRSAQNGARFAKRQLGDMCVSHACGACGAPCLKRPTKSLERCSDDGNVLATCTFVDACSDVGIAVTRSDRKELLRPQIIEQPRNMHCSHHAPTISTGPCPPTAAGPYAAWMPQKSLQGRTCSVSRGGGRARALQQSRRSPALQKPAAPICGERSSFAAAVNRTTYRLSTHAQDDAP